MRRKIYDNLNHVYFVTFSCYRRRRLLDSDQAKGIVVHFSQIKAVEKLSYMHHNPVKAGLVSRPEAWPFGSARRYILNKTVGVPIAAIL